MKTIVKAVAVMRVLASEEREWGVTEVAVATGIDKVITHRILQTFLKEQWVSRNAQTRRYRLGPAAIQLSRGNPSRRGAIEAARPYLQSLSQATGETAFVTVRHAYSVVVAASCESEHLVRVSSQVGNYAPLYCSATGKAFLAFEPPTLLEMTIKRGLLPVSKGTITEPARLRAAIEETARRGWSEEREEFHEHICGVAAPIRGELGFVDACIAVRGPVMRLGSGSLDALAERTSEVAAAISRDLGYQAAATAERMA
jgi:DNA-binding IclR family transcriptional regulator